ncbi:hypothetical protein [Flavobacterium facile]|nr:hypothetical protein [Flavobacterium sp. T-12]
MRKLKLKIAKIADDLEKVTSKELIEYSVIINRIQIKNSIHFVWNLNSIT